MSIETISASLQKAINAYPGSRNSLASSSGVDGAVISRFMNGERSLTLGSADALAATLGLELQPAQPVRPTNRSVAKRRKAKKR